ncbi:polyvinyl alcohol dehydrogenase [Lysobacter helvus]|uniref:Polyvinyl alcohol dehydrogenase n=2 Tax=Lysobacteraceae TaxID=32033 RepID=A0ABM7Q314_9GAMM|nr:MULTISPECIES: STAS domain-containing protein [Lysobacter]BCT91633.1 polyvinyl alcohol dehydrogenase [Lysobacter caseinilyticus]BCT94786.1 polyvinyl alcohol dehydrogenase [Lysobacter helvus]
MPVLPQRTIDAITKNEQSLLARWGQGLETSGATRDARITADELSRQTREFLRLLVSTAATADATNITGKDWADTRTFLDGLSRTRAEQGFDSQHTANFIFSLKRPMFEELQRAYADSPAQLADQLVGVSEMLDALGMHTVRAFQKTREDIINRQQEELLELSTPVVKLWDGVLALPMIGTLDSQRTQVVMESLLQRIVDTGSEIAIIDITGVPTVDTLVAQHLLKTVTAIRLMGADCIISGVRPQIAQTIVHLGLDLQGIVTKANLADALALALKRLNMTVVKAS